MVAYLSAREAARRLNVSDKTVRTWVRNGRLPGEESAHGFRIPADRIEELIVERSAEHDADGRNHTADSTQASDQVADLRAHVADLRSQLEVKDRQISELHTLLAQAQHALPVPSTQRPSAGPTDRVTDEMAPNTSTLTPRAPWWRFWAR